jgi:DNA invertase Pin-like site-specific DNA recombinase
MITAWCPGGPTELVSRAGWLAAETLVKGRKADGIVVARLDRLARDVLVQELLLRKAHRLGGVVLSARIGNDLLTESQKTPAASYFRTILGAISKYDREMIADRLESARKAKAGCRWPRKRRAPVRVSLGGRRPGTAHRASRTAANAKLHDAGKSTREIAATLIAERHPTKSGGRWLSPTVAHILSRDAKAIAMEGN